MVKSFSPSIEQRIVEFARKTGVDIVKARQLAAALQQAAEFDEMLNSLIEDKEPTAAEPEIQTPKPTEKAKKVAKKRAVKATRPLSPETERIRKALLVIRPALKEPITAPELSELLGTELNTVNNSLRYFEATGIVKQAGKAEKVGRGKNPTLWQFVA